MSETLGKVMEGSEIEKIILNKANKINTKALCFNLDPIAFLRALAQKESSYGWNNNPRFEAGYYKGSKLYNKSAALRSLVSKYGKEAASSWSSWQIMYINAVVQGFNGTPKELGFDGVAIDYVIRHINSNIIDRRPKDIEDIFDAYNSGNFSDRIIPREYIKDCMRFYEYFLNHPLIGVNNDTQET